MKRIENIDSYVESISKYPRITIEREGELAEIIRTGSPEEARKAAEELVCANLRLVVKIAHSFKRYRLGLSDLVAEGNVGLLTAVQKFNPEKGAKFSVYAGWWIKQAIRHSLSYDTRTIRVPTRQSNRRGALERATRKWNEEYDGKPDMEWLKKETGLTEKEILFVEGGVSDIVSLDEKVPDMDRDCSYCDALPDEGYDEKDVKGRKTMEEGLDSAMAALTDLDRTLVSLRFGIGCEQQNDSVIAQVAGVAGETVENLLKDAMSRLRRMLSPVREAAFS